jgi:lambda repressor-like predicted transcriptional regulator
MQSVKDLEKAFRRVVAKAAKRENSKAVQDARNALRRKGWSQAAAAVELGISNIQLNYVLNARRESRRILSAIHNLPENPSPA